MRILILESNLNVASSLEKALNEIERDIAIAPKDFNDYPIRVWEDYIERLRPTAVIYRGGIHDVNTGQKNKDLCEILNVFNTGKLLEAAKKADSAFIYVSTANVFDGKKDSSYVENDITHPINEYGMSKAKGEALVRNYEKSYIIRPGWLYGFSDDIIMKTLAKAQSFEEFNKRGNSRVKKIIANCNIYSNPLYINDLAYNIYFMLLKEKYGTYHFFNDGSASKIDLYRYATKFFEIDVPFEERDTGESFDSQIYPENLRLSTVYTDDIISRSWQDAMDDYLFDFVRHERIMQLKNK